MSVSRCLAVVSAAVALALVVALPANARKFQMSGTWVMRNGQVFLPLAEELAVLVEDLRDMFRAYR